MHNILFRQTHFFYGPLLLYITEDIKIKNRSDILLKIDSKEKSDFIIQINGNEMSDQVVMKLNGVLTDIDNIKLYESFDTDRNGEEVNVVSIIKTAYRI